MAEEYYWRRVLREAEERLEAELAKPYDDGCTDSGDYFDPWSLFPGVYGSYSGEFDWCAVDVLEELIADKWHRNDLGAEMFREMLCVQGFCTYGTSPRVCFPDGEKIRSLLPKLVERWKEHYKTHWGHAFPSESERKR